MQKAETSPLPCVVVHNGETPDDVVRGAAFRAYAQEVERVAYEAFRSTTEGRQADAASWIAALPLLARSLEQVLGSCPQASESPSHPKTPAQEKKTPQEVRAEFKKAGISIAYWARQHNVHQQTVYEALRGTSRRKFLRGDLHRVAVLLGLKQGEITPDGDTSSMNVVADRIAA